MNLKVDNYIINFDKLLNFNGKFEWCDYTRTKIELFIHCRSTINSFSCAGNPSLFTSLS